MKRTHQQDVSMQAPSRVMWKRSLLILTAMVVCFTAVGGRLAVLQLAEHDVWQALASEQQLTDRLPWQLGQITGVVEDVVPT